ncbi:hypothetical protein FQA39_LY10787 [Lamprigera yunnana]|nr:hypothetical protein FQA39_LY10787 [Lamprigera yunnana]
MDAFKEIPAINFYGRSNVESNIQHAVEKDIGDVDAPKRSRTRNVYYAEESDSDENDPFHDNDDDQDSSFDRNRNVGPSIKGNTLPDCKPLSFIQKGNDQEIETHETTKGVEDKNIEANTSSAINTLVKEERM